MANTAHSRLVGQIAWLSLAAAVAFGPATARAASPDKGDIMLGRASAMLGSDMLRLAGAEYRSFLAQYPAHGRVAEGQYGLAVCLYRQKDYVAAATQIRKALAAKKFPGRQQAAELLNQCYLAGGDYKNARANLEKLLADRPKGPHAEAANLSLAQSLYMLGEKDKALAAFEKFAKSYPKSEHLSTAHFYIAQCRLARKEYDKAIAAAGASLQADAAGLYTVDISKLLGQCYEAKGDYDRAESKYLTFIMKAPEKQKARGHLNLAVNYYRAGKYAKSIEAIDILLKKYPSSESARAGRVQLGLSQFADGQHAKAHQTLEAVAAQSPDEAPRARYWISRCDMALGNHAAAYKALKLLADAKNTPNNLERISFEIVVCLVNMGKWDTAVKACGQFLSKWPESPLTGEVTYHRATCLNRLEDYLRSNQDCRELLKQAKSPHASEARELMGENLLALKKYAQAEKTYAALAKSEPDNKRYQFRLGQCAYCQDNYESAAATLGALGKAHEVAKDPTLNRSLFLLGCSQLQLKENAPAAETFKAYLSTAKHDRNEAIYRLAQAQRRAGKLRQANVTLLDLFWNTKKLKDKWAIRAAFDYGYDAFAKNDAKQAAPALEKVARADAPDELAAPAAYMLAWLDFNADKYDRAADKFVEITARWPKHQCAGDCVYYGGFARHRAGNNAQAIVLLDRYIKNQPTGPHAEEARNLKAFCAKTKSQPANPPKPPKTPKPAVDPPAIPKTPKPPVDTPGAIKIKSADKLIAKKDYAGAAKLLAEALKDKTASGQSDPVNEYRLGQCLQLAGEPKLAAVALASYIGRHPRHVHAAAAKYQIAMISAKLGDLTKARKQLTELLQSESRGDAVESARISLGNFYAADDDFERAGQAYALFLKEHPKSKQLLQAQYGMGWALHNQKKYAEARTWYAKVVSTDNGLTAAKAQLQIGRTRMAQSEFRQATKDFLKADVIHKDPQNSSKALCEAGLAFEKLGDLKMAIEQYRLCVKKYPDRPWTRLAGARLKAIEP